MCSTLGIAGAKSRPGFAVPDSVHHVKLASPCTLPLRRTVMRAAWSLVSTSTASDAISTRIGPALPARTDVSPMEGRAPVEGRAGAVAAPGPGVGLGGAATVGAVATTVEAATVGAEAVGAVAAGAVGAAAVGVVAVVAALLEAVAVGAGA